MSDCCTLASASHRKPLRRHQGFVILRSVIGRWFWRIRIRSEWKRRSEIKSVPIDDLGLTEQQLGAESTSFFWHV